MSLFKDLSPLVRIIVIAVMILLLVATVLSVLLLQKHSKTDPVIPANKQVKTINVPTPNTSETEIDQVVPPYVGSHQVTVNGGFITTTHSSGFSVTYPNKYVKLGDSDFTLSFDGPNSNQPGPQDYASLNFRVSPLNGKKLERIVQEDHGAYVENAMNSVDEIVPITLNGTAGYKYSCSFLVPQECIYLSLPNDRYLQIIMTNADTENRGYKNEIDGIISTITINSK